MNVNVLVADLAPNPLALVFFGGRPSLPKAMKHDWPRCSQCSGPMQYLGRVPHPNPSKQIFIFQCANDPGMCDEWDPESGGNCAMIVDIADAVRPTKPPRKGVTALDGTWSGHAEECVADSYSDAREEADANGWSVIGQLGGVPDWLQEDETPECPACGNPMVLAAQLEEGPDDRTAMNFGGGGCGYVFVCPCPAGEARFLWQ